MAGKVGRPPSAKSPKIQRMSKGDAQKYAEELEIKIEKMEEGAYCYLCDKHKPKSDFYKSTDPLSLGGVTPICKDCAKGIARRRDRNGDDHSPTKESVQLALFYMNKPYLDSVWDASMEECNNKNNASGKKPENYDVFASYMKNIAMPQYVGKTWRNSDVFKERVIYEDEKTVEGLLEGREDQDTYVDYLKNKADVKRLLSYDPFEKESLDDQPFLYSQLLGLLDGAEDATEDFMRTTSCIAIVRGFLQQSKLDDAIAKLMADPKGFEKNSATIKSYQDSKAKITSMIKDLAAESCISLKNNKLSKKGENTFTGKSKKIKQLGIREGRVNGFDIMTCKGMQQVQEISDASIMAQLRLDESEWSDMVAEQREMIVELRKEKEIYKELNRILLQENLDLKDYMAEKEIDYSGELKNLSEMYSPFADRDNEEGDSDE